MHSRGTRRFLGCKWCLANWAFCGFVDVHLAPPSVSCQVKPVGKPDAGNPHVRFDERGWETGDCQQASHRARPRLYQPLTDS